jgi:hypothetical protein
MGISPTMMMGMSNTTMIIMVVTMKLVGRSDATPTSGCWKEDTA